MTLEIKPELQKYIKFSEDGTSIEGYVCPVPGCNYSTTQIQGPGALRMHLLLTGDPEIEHGKNIYDRKAHEKFLNEHKDELTLDVVRELYQVIQR